MLERALAAGVPAGWVTADEVYGNSPALRGWLEARQLPYVRRSRPPGRCRRPPGRPRRRRGWPSVSRASAGCASALARAPRAATGMGGPACRWPASARPPGGSGGCWCAGAFAPGSWPTTCAPPRPSCRWSPWCGSLGPAGGWRCVNRSALIYANWLHDLGSRCGLVALSRPSVGGCTSRAGGTGAGGARRAGRGRRG
jgi:DDE superfamily endonuclease